MSADEAKSPSPAPGGWTHKIPARPTLNLYEVEGRNEIIVWAKWWDPTLGKRGGPRTKTTGLSVRFPPGHRRAGKVSPAREQKVLNLASLWHADLVSGKVPGTTPEAADRPDGDEAQALTLGEGFARYLDLDEGRYPAHDDPERADVARAAEEIKGVLGADVTISSLVPAAAAQTIWRRIEKRFAHAGSHAARAAVSGGRKRSNRHRRSRRSNRGSDGAVWARRVVNHFFSCMDWLRSRALIPQAACVRPPGWTSDFKADWRRLTGRDLDEEQEKPRFTPAEAGRLLDKVLDERVDPRLKMNMLVGGDSLRSGQVRRAMRSDLDLSPCGEFGLGRLRVKGKGRKKGSTVDLDLVVRAQIDHEMIDGYLRDCEAAYRDGRITDYALMPQGRFVRGAVPVRNDAKYNRPISRRTLLDYFHFLEEIAEVEHVESRAWYGLRRLWTDLGPEHVQTPRAREVLGGWARGSKVPEQVYASRDDEQAIRDASRARSTIREALRTGQLPELVDLRVAISREMAHCTDRDVLQWVLQALRTPVAPTPEAVDGGSDS
jgi:hypothetical protein